LPRSIASLAGGAFFCEPNGVVCYPMIKPSNYNFRHGPLQAGHPWIVVMTAVFGFLNKSCHPCVARLKRAMTDGVWVEGFKPADTGVGGIDFIPTSNALKQFRIRKGQL
jgi:hypothetical protein